LAYNVGYKSSVQRDPKKLPKAEARHVLSQIEEELSKNADAYPALKGQFAADSLILIAGQVVAELGRCERERHHWPFHQRMLAEQ
jgi:hypothetical protein